MPELEKHTPASTTSPDDDPISHLHKMSTTAGVASMEYVAINSAAIASALLGAATALALVHHYFLIIAAAGLLAGLVALHQIRNSNGTQGGRWLAVGGIVLSLLFGGIVGAKKLSQARYEKREMERINHVLRDIGQRLMAGDYAGAYAMFHPRFKEHISLPRFEQEWRLREVTLGKMKKFEPNNVVDFTPYEGYVAASTQAITSHEKGQEDPRIVLVFRGDEGQPWLVANVVDMFLDRNTPAAPAFGPAGPPVQ